MIPPWKIFIVVICFASVALGDDFKTIDGKEYKDAKVSRVEPDGLVLITKSGISKVYFTELPKDVQERFGYDPHKAAEFQAQATERNADYLRQSKEDEQKRLEERQKYWSEHPMQSITSGRADLSGSSLEPTSGETWLIEGRVAQFVDGGILIHTVAIVEVGMRQMPDGSTVYVAGKFDQYADGDMIKMFATEAGRYSFANTGGGGSNVRAFAVKQLFHLPPGQL